MAGKKNTRGDAKTYVCVPHERALVIEESKRGLEAKVEERVYTSSEVSVMFRNLGSSLTPQTITKNLGDKSVGQIEISGLGTRHAYRETDVYEYLKEKGLMEDLEIEDIQELQLHIPTDGIYETKNKRSH